MTFRQTTDFLLYDWLAVESLRSRARFADHSRETFAPFNMIHEGTHGIQALDLLGRKVVMDGGKGLALLARNINQIVERSLHVSALAEHANALAAAMKALGHAKRAAWASGDPEEALANATPYLQAFGHTVIAWIWLDVGLSAQALLGR